MPDRDDIRARVDYGLPLLPADVAWLLTALEAAEAERDAARAEIHEAHARLDSTIERLTAFLVGGANDADS